MTDKTENDMFEKITEKINGAESILIFTHINPDGDAIGSSWALMKALGKIGKKAQIILNEPLGDFFSMFGSDYPTPETFSGEYDLKIALDSSDTKRLGKAYEFFKGDTVLIDHHGTNTRYAGICYVDEDSPSTGEIIFDLLEEMGIERDREISNGIYAALMTDTGGFMYSNTTADTHKKAALLIESGAEYIMLNRKLNVEKSYKMHRLSAHCIDCMEFFEDGKICLSFFDNKFCEENNITLDDLNGMSGVVSSVKGVEIAILISETVKGELKVSLRSVENADVSVISTAFGGGGHMKAAGFLAENISYDELKNKLIEMARERI